MTDKKELEEFESIQMELRNKIASIDLGLLGSIFYCASKSASSMYREGRLTNTINEVLELSKQLSQLEEKLKYLRIWNTNS